MAGEKCLGKKRDGVGLCQRPAGWGTSHPGEGRCKLHGGSSKGPKDQRGNKNAVTTGAYEAIYADQLAGEEHELFALVDVSPRSQVEEEIRLLSIRERRMLARIKELVEGPETTGVTSTKSTVGVHRGEVDLTEVLAEATLERVMRVEAALTRVQAQKTRAVEQLRKIESEAPPEDDPLERFLKQMAEARAARAAREERAKGEL